MSISREEKISAYRSATECKSNEELVDLVIGWTDRYGSLPSPVNSLILIMQLKLIAKKCGFSRITQNKQNILLETPMEETAFRSLRKGLPDHLQGRMIYTERSGKESLVTARGLGVLPVEKQIEQLKEWLGSMVEQINQNSEK